MVPGQARWNKRDPPVANGIELVSTHSLSDRLRSIFTFPLFNAVQSKSFHTVFRTDDNFVLSSPTGSGKTAVLELAICRLFSTYPGSSFKVVYQAPTKSLCSERQRDWQSKFSHLNLSCAELTGDTDQTQLRHVQSADIIITTPEKWDTMTRKWKDHRKLMDLVKLFLIDEVHILKEDRGASLEVVVSRMKSVGSDVRFIALSASIPNSEDIAIWLGKNRIETMMPAAREVFGEEFRPVQLQKYVCGYRSDTNDFAFDKVCDSKLPDVISTYSANKPIMIFCFTRGSTEITARGLAEWWNGSMPDMRYWPGPKQRIHVEDKKLQVCTEAGVAFHHAGISQSDRQAVEKAYIRGDINVICCTSTLAVGVNLPCHFVIIKNTVCYQNHGCKEYSDLEIMQMLGRAGRPQYDDTAVSIIMTRQDKVSRYEKMVSGQEILESRLHVNLIDHLNAEIGLGTVTNFESARKWLAGTFLAVRLVANPGHYKFNDRSTSTEFHTTLNAICRRDVEMLQKYELVTTQEPFKSTEFGDAMARYYIQFDTMKTILALESRAEISEILSTISQASEFKSIRLRPTEKHMFKEINNSPIIRFPIKVDLALPAHKVSLVLQSMLGGLDLRNDDRFKAQFVQFNADQSFILQHVHRLVRCVVDCQLHIGDSVSARNAMELARSLGAKVWDESSLQLMQVEKIGPAAYRKLVNAGIKNIQELENTDPFQLNMIMSRNPPFGHQLLEAAKSFPKLRISVKMVGSPAITQSNSGRTVRIQIKIEVGFMNETIPLFFNKKPVHVCVLAESSDGKKLHFCKIKAQRLTSAQTFFFSTDMTSAQQFITCYASCDDIAGSARQATLQPDIPEPYFMTKSRPDHEVLQKGRGSGVNLRLGDQHTHMIESLAAHQQDKSSENHRPTSARSESFDDSDLQDSDLRDVAVGIEYDNIDDFEEEGSQNTQNSLAGTGKQRQPAVLSKILSNTTSPVPKLPNGKYACSHNCKDKKTCRHLCCREGMDKPPRASKHGAINHTKSTSGRIAAKAGYDQINKFVKQGNLQHTEVNIATKQAARTERDSAKIRDYDLSSFKHTDKGSNISANESSDKTNRDIQQSLGTQSDLFMPYNSSSPGKIEIAEVNLTGQTLKRNGPMEPASRREYAQEPKRPRTRDKICSRHFRSLQDTVEEISSGQVAQDLEEHSLGEESSRDWHGAEDNKSTSNEELGTLKSQMPEVWSNLESCERVITDVNLEEMPVPGSGGTHFENLYSTDNTELSLVEIDLPEKNDGFEQWIMKEFGSCIDFV